MLYGHPRIFFYYFEISGNCPSGWVQLHKKCIQLFSTSANLPTAKRFCENAGAKVFIPREKSEIRELAHTMALFGLREEESWPWVGKGFKTGRKINSRLKFLKSDILAIFSAKNSCF